MNPEDPSDGLASYLPASSEPAGVGGVFQSRAWLRHWVRHRGQDLEPFPIVVDDGATFAPLGRTRVAGVRVLRLLGTGDSDVTGVISIRAPAFAWDSVICEVARRRHEWDLLHLHSVADRDVIIHCLKRHLGNMGVDRIYEWCPLIRIAGPWEQFLSCRKKLRYELKRWSKRLEEIGPVSVSAIQLPLGYDMLEEIVRVEQDSWKWAHGNPAFKPGTLRDFLFALLQDSQMPARVWTLKVGERFAAVALVLEESSRWCYYYAAYRQDFKNSGALLLARIVEAAHTAGCTSFSLLRGEHGYKAAWTEEREPVFEIVCASNLLGRGAVLAYQLRWRAAGSPMLRRIRSSVFRVGDRR